MPLVHLTARLRQPVRGRLDRQHAAWLWRHLRRAFPNALAAVLMPNHPHVFAEVDEVDEAHATFVKVLAALARRTRWPRPVWEPVPEPGVISGPDKVLRQIRYIALNPTRARLVDDPLAWYWSTHRDVLGATHDPWVTFDALQSYLPAHMQTGVERLHAHVSADPSTQVDGTPLPTPAIDAAIQSHPLVTILGAAMIATRGSMQGHRRRGPMRDALVWLAAAQGWSDTPRLAQLCDVTPNAIARILRGSPPPALAHARLCLGDGRLMSAAAELFAHGRGALDVTPAARAIPG